MTNEKSCGMIGITQGREQSPSGNANGSIAQLGEHLPYKQRVIGSSPIVPTIKKASTVSVLFSVMFALRQVESLDCGCKL